MKHSVKIVMITALVAAVITSCDKDKTPGWFTDAKSKFSNGRFVPEMQDIVPVSILGPSAAKASTVAGISAKSVDEYTKLPFTEIRKSSDRGIKSMLSTITTWRNTMLDLKDDIVEDFGNSGLTQQNVWAELTKTRVKYTEDANGRYIYWIRKELPPRRSESAKLSMYNDGSNEIRYFQNEDGENPVGGLYSYLKGDKYMIVCPGPEGFWYFSSDKQNGIRKGKSFSASGNGANEKGFNISEFKGDASNFVSNVLIDQVHGEAERYTAQSAYSIINGVICPYFDNELDIKAFDNIVEIYYEKEGPKSYIVKGLKLTDNSIIDLTDQSGHLSFQEAEEFIEDDLTGHWGFFPTDSYNIKLWLNLSGGTSSLSGCIPALLSQLHLAAGFEDLYVNLKSQSVGYFDDYYVSEFQPIENIELNVANIQTIINLASYYVLTPYDEF